MFAEKLFHGPVEVEAVLFVVEAVAFVFFDHISTSMPRFRRAATIWSDSAFFTRGSLAPWATNKGALIRSA